MPMPTYRFSQCEIASKGFRMQVSRQHAISLPRLGKGSIRKTTMFEISPQQTDWFKGHRVNGAYVVPGAGMLAMIFDFLPNMGHATDKQLDDVVFEAPLVLNTAESTVQIGIQVECGDQPRVALYSRMIGKKDTWTRNAVAVVGSIASWPDEAKPFAKGGKAVASEALYAQFARQGLEYGPQYKRIESSRRAEKAFHVRLCALSNATGLTGLITALNACCRRRAVR
ncbi:hypothetical protein AJ87_21000 [Rhizobium yanglingense]|nr:hypothetical protein AJ87_21000 [Rhizobium yanglingense]